MTRDEKRMVRELRDEDNITVMSSDDALQLPVLSSSCEVEKMMRLLAKRAVLLLL